MANKPLNNFRLGIFVIAGVALLAFALYMIGQNQSFFGSNFAIKTRVKNVSGLMPGNNVRFSGIQCGTVKSIEIMQDTLIEVTMLIDTKTSHFIRDNARVSIGNEGLMGNKVVNIEPGSGSGVPIVDGSLLQPDPGTDINSMLNTLSGAGDNIAAISEELKIVVHKLNSNPVLWQILADTSIPANLRYTLMNTGKAAARIEHASQSLDELMTGVLNGKGAAGMLLTDGRFSAGLSETANQLQSATRNVNSLISNIDSLVVGLGNDVNHGEGTIHALLKDPNIVTQLNTSLENINRGTAAFSEDMEALKHNFLLRGYFRKQEKKARKEGRDKETVVNN